MNDNKEMLGTAPIGKLLFKLALPTVVAQLINMLYNIVDRIYIGHMPGDGSLALTGVGVCIELLTKETRGILSVNGDDGYPYGMPMNHFYNSEDGCIYFHCGKNGHRLDALKNSDKVSFCVCEQGFKEAEDWAYTVRSVIVFGRMQIVDDLTEVSRIARLLSYKFTQDEDYIQNEIRQYAKATLLLKLIPEHICGKKVKES